VAREHRQYKYSQGDVAISQLRFDRENPRLPPGIDSEDKEAILRFMLDDAGLLELASSIAVQGYFPGEPLLVCPYPELDPDSAPPVPGEDDMYTVVEGNRRLAAVTLLQNPTLAPVRKNAVAQLAEDGGPDKLPVTVFPTRDDILDYLGYRHITGIKEWDPLPKARYLAQVRERREAAGEPSDNKSLARIIGSNSTYVGRLLTALRAFNRLEDLGFFGKYKLDAESLPFAVFSTSLNYEKIPPWLGIDATSDDSVDSIDDERLLTLARWFFVPSEKVTPEAKPLLRESRNIRYINLIVEDEEATAALEDGATPISAAALTLDAGEAFSNALNESNRTLKVARRRLREVDEPTEADRAVVGELRENVEQIDQEIAAKATTKSG
jgi:hypothetical protein